MIVHYQLVVLPDIKLMILMILKETLRGPSSWHHTLLSYSVLQDTINGESKCL